MRKAIMAMAVLALGLVGATPALGFGTLHGFGQNAEHERITRAALNDWAPNTLNEIAGRYGRFGGVGSPDNPFRGLVFTSEAHCDNGDYLATNGPVAYPQSQADAQTHLERCRAWMVQWLDRAVHDAAPLAQPGAKNTALDCVFVGQANSAKCAVLADLGIAFHAAQDFYAHTNWVDRVTGETSATNPPGLGNEGRAPWLDPRATLPFPQGLISGCFGGVPESWYCKYNLDDVRVRHAVLNKDEGPIGPAGATGPGETPRGAANGNFERAVAAAIDDTRDKWAYFQEQVMNAYGAQGPRIICVVKSDDLARCP
ncbi:MAG: hypothetical protein ABUS57_10750 [Pseudomonadota bacterium]